MSILSLNQLRFLAQFNIGDEFLSSQVRDTLSKKQTSLGGVLSGLQRAGYIKPLHKLENRDVLWERIK